MPKSSESVHFEIDAYAPGQIAQRVEAAAVNKTRLTFIQLFALAVLAGAFIAFGALFYTLAITGSTLGFGPTRLIGGVAFSLGLVLVIIAGAELFTGNNLMVMAWADRHITLRQLLYNWLVVYLGNFVGALATAFLVIRAGVYDLGGPELAEQARLITQGKLSLSYDQAFFRGVLCNALVCLAVWLSFAARTVTDKVLAIVFPISAFVACGFEHSVANMFVIPVAMMGGFFELEIMRFLNNLVFVTLGNIVGGSVFVALIYWLIYIRNR